MRTLVGSLALAIALAIGTIPFASAAARPPIQAAR